MIVQKYPVYCEGDSIEILCQKWEKWNQEEKIRVRDKLKDNKDFEDAVERVIVSNSKGFITRSEQDTLDVINEYKLRLSGERD